MKEKEIIWCWMLIGTVVFGIILKYLSEAGAVGFFIIWTFGTGMKIGFWDLPKRKPTKHNCG